MTTSSTRDKMAGQSFCVGELRMTGYSHRGFCPCCEQDVVFTAANDWFRDHLICSNCDSVVRERALALVLREIQPLWPWYAIHESSPMDRGISRKLRLGAKDYVATQFFPHSPLGEIIAGFRNEDLENQTFPNERFEIVVSLDVMEHVFQPAKVYQEVYRTLKPGGHYLHTFPIRKWLVDPITPRARLLADKSVEHLVDAPEYHGNPVDTSGSLVTYDYGYDISRQIAQWVPFDVRILRFWDQHHGVIGEYTEVVVCKKRA